jgi:hypothetical protein
MTALLAHRNYRMFFLGREQMDGWPYGRQLIRRFRRRETGWQLGLIDWPVSTMLIRIRMIPPGARFH